MPGWVRGLIVLLMRIWFRRIEVVGAANAPAKGPLIVVGNHENGLIDPMLIATALPLKPRFVAKSTLWKNPLLRLFFWLAKIIPVYRKQDVAEGADPTKNAEMFQATAKVLADGGVICLFPEGQSHTEPQLQPLKTGTARMALAAPADVRILPVGIAFDQRDKFRSRGLAVVGEPIDTKAERAIADEREAVHRLTDRIAEALKLVTINVPTWEERRLLERAVEISRGGESLESRTRLLQTFYEAYRLLMERKPAEVEALRKEVARYDRSLRLLGIRDEDVRVKYDGGSVGRWILRLVRLILLRAPMGIAGTILHWLPYQAPRRIAARHAEELDQPASWKLMAGFVIYPLWWLLLAGIVTALRGPELGLLTLVVVPMTGWVALQWTESGLTLGEQARTYLRRSSGRELFEELQRRRETIRTEIAALEAAWRASAPAAAAQGGATR